jgi:flagellar biosynthetic protein FlhB
MLSERRKTQAREAGIVVRSAQICALSVVASVFVAVLLIGIAPLKEVMRRGLTLSAEIEPMSLMTDALTAAGLLVLPLLVLALLAGLASNIAQVGWHFTPTRGAFGNARFGVLNVAALVGIFVWTMAGHFDALFGSLSDAGHVVVVFLVRSMVALALVAILDYVLARRRHEAALELSPAEALREIRENEGDPHVRNIHRRLVTSLARESHAGQDTGVAQASGEVRS